MSNFFRSSRFYDIAKIAGPISLGQSAGPISSVILLALVGHNDVMELAYFAVVISVFGPIFAISCLMLGGMQNFSAELKGRADDTGLLKLFCNGFILSLSIGVIAFFLSKSLAILIYDHVGGGLDTKRLQSIHQLFSWAIPFVVVSTTFSLFLQGTGKQSTVAKLNFVDVFLQISLSYFLMDYRIVLGIGVAESVIAAFVISDIVINLLLGRQCVRMLGLFSVIQGVLLQFSRRQLSELLRFGVPIACGMGTQKATLSVLTLMIASTGAENASAYSITLSIIHLLQIPMIGVSQGNSILVSKDAGAKLEDSYHRRLSTAALLTFNFVFLTSFVWYLFCAELAKIFTTEIFLIDIVAGVQFPVMFFIGANSFVLLMMAHQRAKRDVIWPQMVMNCSLIFIAVAGGYTLLQMSMLDLTSILMLHSTALFIVGLAIWRRSQIPRLVRATQC